MDIELDYATWRQAVAEAAEEAKERGVEEAVRRAADQLRDQVDREAVGRLVEQLKRRYRIGGEDAQAAFLVLEAFYWEQAIRRQPLRGRLKRWLATLLGYRYPRPVLTLPERVVFAAPGGDTCPIWEACEQDPQRCRPLCEASLEAGILMHPLEMALVDAVGPTVRWEIDEIGSTTERRCYYAISSEPEKDRTTNAK